MNPTRTGPTSPPTPTILDAGQYTRVALGFLALALYGSLVPFGYRPLPPGEALARFVAIPNYHLGIESRSDWVANILLFVPLGFLALAALGVDRRRAVGWLAAPAVVVACGLLGAAIEFVQLFFPPRTVSQNDVVAEALGGLLGAALWLACGQRMTDWARRTWAAIGTRGLAARLLPGYVAFLVLIHVMPLDLTISPVEVYHKFRQGRVRLVPFDRPGMGPAELISKDLWNVAYFLPLGLLLARDRGGWRGGWRALGMGLGMAALVESLQLFVYTRACDATDVVTGGLAVLAGWWAGRVGLGAPGRAARPVLLLAWLGVLIAVHWQPLDFDPASAPRRWEDLSWTPFADYYWGTEYNAFDQILRKSLLFLPVGALLAPNRRAVLVGLALATGLEAGQLFLPSRTPSVTDVLVEGVGVWIGAGLARRAAASTELRSPNRERP